MSQIIPPLDNLVLSYHIFKVFEKSKVDQFFYLSGKAVGRSLINEQINKLGLKKDINSLKYNLKEFELLSFGKVNLIKFDKKNKKVIIKNLNNPFAKRYARLFGVQKGPVDYYLQGIYTGISEVILDSEMTAKEIKCIAKGDNSCLIEIGQKEEGTDVFEKDEKIKFIEDKLTWENLKGESEKPGLPPSAVQRILHSEHLTMQDGWLKIMKIPVGVIPTNVLILTQFLGWKNIEDLLYYIGKIHGKKSATVMSEVFGFKKDRKLLEIMFEQTALMGVGHLIIEDFNIDKKEARVTTKDNIFGKQFSKLYGKQNSKADHLTRGLIAGMCEIIFEERVWCSEEACIGGGDPNCEFVAVQESKKPTSVTKGYRLVESKCKDMLKWDRIFEQSL